MCFSVSSQPLNFQHLIMSEIITLHPPMVFPYQVNHFLVPICDWLVHNDPSSLWFFPYRVNISQIHCSQPVIGQFIINDSSSLWFFPYRVNISQIHCCKFILLIQMNSHGVNLSYFFRTELQMNTNLCYLLLIPILHPFKFFGYAFF